MTNLRILLSPSNRIVASRCFSATRPRYLTTIQTSSINLSLRVESMPIHRLRSMLKYKKETSRYCFPVYLNQTCYFSTENRPPSSSEEKPKKTTKKAVENAQQVFKMIKGQIPAHENIYTIPNLLTFSRLVASPFLGYLIIIEQYKYALALMGIAAITDLVDGHIARKYNMKTVVGSIIDPAADKMLMTVLTVTLAMKDLLPVPLAAIILGRDIGLVISSFYYRYISLPPPKTLTRYFDFSIPSAEVHPTMISKVNTALQMLLMGVTLAAPVAGWTDAIALVGLQWIVGTTTVASGASYVLSKDAVKILHRIPKE
ncbi:uncharacterized protein VTP21DRAFT_606 [Calcarisporiella thermophila]|uniref:uncharacterized protein n=1 Tax=Calcarisporiella thermophila TaxID=911321 RepID=UPI00374235B6